MNGRIYDSEIARFLSPDPIIQDPYNMLSYNRYSYCLNNPLKYIDPSGYSYKAMLERDHSWSEPAAEFFNNYPGGWAQMQESNYRGAWQYYASMSFMRLVFSTSSKIELGVRGKESGYWITSREYSVNPNEGNVNSLNNAGSVNLTLAFVPLQSTSFVGGFYNGFLNPHSTTSETAPSTIIGGQGLLVELAKLAAKSEATAAKTSSALNTALSAAKYVKYAGKALGGIGAIATGIEGALDGNGFTWGDGAKVAIGLATIFTPVGWVYGIIDLGTAVVSGTSISDRIGSGIDNSLNVNKLP